jgi:hypothetical protein
MKFIIIIIIKNLMIDTKSFFQGQKTIKIILIILEIIHILNKIIYFVILSEIRLIFLFLMSD